MGINNENCQKERFCRLWGRCLPSSESDDADDVWEQLCVLYAEPHRHYHNLMHIAHCLREFDGARHLMNEADTIELALWFHDAIYEISAGNNEARSVELFRDLASGRMDASRADRIESLIMATTHKKTVDDIDCQFIIDIDLSSFGLPWQTFKTNSEAIRQEQSMTVNEEAKFLDSLVARERIFQTDFFHDRLEKTARNNIARYSAFGLSAN